MNETGILFCFLVMGFRHPRVCSSSSDIWRQCVLPSGHQGVHRVWNIREPSSGNTFRAIFTNCECRKTKTRVLTCPFSKDADDPVNQSQTLSKCV